MPQVPSDLSRYARSVVEPLTNAQLDVEARFWRREALPGPLTDAFRAACHEVLLRRVRPVASR